MDRHLMKLNAISLDEALHQGSTAGNMSAVSNYYLRQSAASGAEIRNLQKHQKTFRLTKAQEHRLRQLTAAKQKFDQLTVHFSAIAATMRRIGRV